MLNDLLWFPTRAIPLLWAWGGGLHRSATAWLGYALALAALLLLVACVRSLLKLHLVRAAAFLLLGAILGVCGSAMAGFGTHFDRGDGGGTAIAGAQVLELDGPATADLGTLVLIGGYGSESPVFSEPAVFREAGAESADPVVARFHRRVIVRLHGGFGWNDSIRAANIAATIQSWLEQKESAWKDGSRRYNVVVAHSRGSQVLAMTPWFRKHGWQRIAVHPPAGVNLLFRLFDFACPEIDEIDDTGARLLHEFRYGGGKKLQPWTAVYQAWGWDQTVDRFPEDTGLVLRNEGPFGSHVTPFCDRNSYFWREFENSLPPRKDAAPAVSAEKRPSVQAAASPAA